MHLDRLWNRALLASLAFGLAACGGGREDATPPATPPQALAAAGADALEAPAHLRDGRDGRDGADRDDDDAARGPDGRDDDQDSDREDGDDRRGHEGVGVLRLSVISSPAAWVSGGDARIRVQAAAGLRDHLQLWLNGRRVAAAFEAVEGGLEAVVGGLREGRNRLEVRHARARGLRSVMELVNHPVTGPMFSGPQQVPFVCTTIQGAVGVQPLVDSAVPPGYRVTDAQGQVIGYSRQCSIDTMVRYFYGDAAGVLKPLPADGSRPADLAPLTLADGRVVDYVVRREVGAINRFLYSIAMLAPFGEDPAAAPDTSAWNRKLVYWFQGGVAIGHSQGAVHGGSMNPDLLSRGYAIVHSSGNVTDTHYNMQLAGETAMMTKERFVERYGAPLYTIGLGGSGGAIQQYLIAQNQPGVLDGLLPVQSYPDMVTQTIHVGDCELLEHYMDVTDRANPKWRVTKNRSLLVGFNAEEGFARVNDPFAPLKAALGYSSALGATECVPAWRGLTPLAMNPLYGQVPNQQFYEPQSDIAAIRWTHYDDLRNIYGTDDSGAALTSWDNTGVPYGLVSLKAGQITPAEFLHLNRFVGGWKRPSEMVQETFPFFGTGAAEINKALSVPGYFDPWSAKNMRLSPDGLAPAPRSRGDLAAQRASYRSGHVFGGRLTVPAIDHRQYLERELDMHNSHQSFAARERIRQRMGHSANQVIWFTDTRPGEPRASQTLQALAVMDEWLANMKARPWAGVAGNKPAAAVDSCFDRAGQPMATGDGVWDGILDARAAGTCTQAFPLYRTSRIVAGAPFDGRMYRCALQSVDAALARGAFAPWVPDAAEAAQLREIFPEGVCDYRRRDQARS
jgi:hypothetical protein